MRTGRAMIISALFLLSGCGTGPGEQSADPEDVLADFEAAWEGRSIDSLSACLASDFVYELPPELWDDYSIPPDGVIDSCLVRELYLDFAGITFYLADSISLTLLGNGHQVWPGDSTGESMILTRQFVLDVSYPDSISETSGTWDFIAMPEGDGWIISRIIEQSGV
jgi:hypothetical protein